MHSEKGSATVSVALFGVSPNSRRGRFHSPFSAPARVLPTRRRDADGSGREYLFSELGTPQRGPRTGTVRSAWAGRGALEKGDVFGPDNPLRTGTVRGPTQGGARTVPGRTAPEQRSRLEKSPTAILQS